MIQNFLLSVMLFFIGASFWTTIAEAQLIGSSHSLTEGTSPFSVSMGVKYTGHYNFENDSILTPPKILYVGAQVGYMMDDWFMPYAEFNMSISQVTGRTIFGGIKLYIIKKNFPKSRSAVLRGFWLSLNADYGLVSIAPPTPPQVYIDTEWLPRFGGSFMVLLGKGKTFVEGTGLIYNQSNSNLMVSVGVNIGFLVY